MTYSHTNKAGNPCDVWKHFWLCHLVTSIIDQHSERQISIFDTHCGVGHFWLNESSNWESGIGAFCQETQWAHLGPYGDIIRPYALLGQYLGSWALTASLLSSRGCVFNIHACDTSPIVASEIYTVAHRLGFESLIHFFNSDGFREVSLSTTADLVLIDPPYSSHTEKDWDDSSKTIGILLNANLAGMLWYPFFRHAEPQRLVDKTGQIGHEILWDVLGDTPDQDMKGCGVILFGIPEMVTEKIGASGEAVAQVMGATYKVRQPR